MIKVDYFDWISILNCYVDLVLMGILYFFFVFYYNDFYFFNFFDIFIFVIYGVDDDNVFLWYFCVYVVLVFLWVGEKDSLIKVLEILKRGYWWDDVFSLLDVVDFI